MIPGFHCRKQNCMCHWLCQSGHFNLDTSHILTGCTYFPSIIRHLEFSEGDEFELCLCMKSCSGSRSDGTVKIKVISGRPTVSN